ncbi:MAG: hypothetical protein ABR590_09965 [Spirochaetia bacterium]
MENDTNNDYVREYAPYESATAFLKKRLKGQDRVRWSFVIQGIPDEAAARIIELQVKACFAQELELNSRSVEDGAGATWRLTARTVPGKLPKEKDFHERAGWLWGLASHYGARLESLAFQLE